MVIFQVSVVPVEMLLATWNALSVLNFLFEVFDGLSRFSVNYNGLCNYCSDVKLYLKMVV